MTFDDSVVTVTFSHPLTGLAFPATKPLGIHTVHHFVADLGLPGKNSSLRRMRVNKKSRKERHFTIQGKVKALLSS